MQIQIYVADVQRVGAGVIPSTRTYGGRVEAGKQDGYPAVPGRPKVTEKVRRASRSRSHAALSQSREYW